MLSMLIPAHLLKRAEHGKVICWRVGATTDLSKPLWKLESYSRRVTSGWSKGDLGQELSSALAPLIQLRQSGRCQTR